MSLTNSTASTCPTSTTEGRDWGPFVHRQRPTIRRRLRSALRRNDQRPTPEWLDDLEQEVYCRLLDHDRRKPPRQSTFGPEHRRFLEVLADSTVADDLRKRCAAKRDWRATFALPADDAGLLASRFVCRRPTPEQGVVERDSFRKTVARLRSFAKGPSGKQSVEALVLTAVAGLTSREVAARASTTLAASSVETRLCRLKARLRAELSAPQG